MPTISGMNINLSIQHACDAFGGVSGLARQLGVKAPTVSQWVNGKRPIPAERCPQIEQVTGGLVRCEDLRPDVNWAVLRGPCPEQQAA